MRVPRSRLPKLIASLAVVSALGATTGCENLVCTVGLCADPVAPGVELGPVTAEPTVQWSGGEVVLRLPVFTEITLTPLRDEGGAIVPNRWQNFAVTVVGDTADTWRAGPDAIAFRVPPLLTGDHTATVRVAGFHPQPVAFHSVGLARAPSALLFAHTNTKHGLPLPPSRALAMEEIGGTADDLGYLLLDLRDGSRRVIPGLHADYEAGITVRMYVPGPSYRPGHFLVDLAAPSRPGEASLRVWRSEPTFVPVDSLACGDPVWYTAAELAPSICLHATFDGEVWRNGTELMLTDRALHLSQFEMANSGRWTVLTTRQPLKDLDAWPVFNSSGNIAYARADFLEVPGATFSSRGDTLYVVARGVGSTQWSLVVMEAATGLTIASRRFDDLRLIDVLADPVFPRLYIAGVLSAPLDPGVDERLVLHVLERGTLEEVASVEDPTDPLFPWAMQFGDLVHGGSSGRIHVFGWCGSDCGGLWDFAFDVLR